MYKFRVASEEQHNKMSLQNLATVFGPTLLRPAANDQQPASMDQLFSMGARDAMIQTGILLFYLSLREKGMDFVNGSANVTKF
jgi:breakpoint cluster region protein